MFYCNHCKEKFEFPSKEKISHNEIDFGSETYDICPYCGDDDFEEMEVCEICKEYKRPDVMCDCTAYIFGELDKAIEDIRWRYECENKVLEDTVDTWFNSRF